MHLGKFNKTVALLLSLFFFTATSSFSQLVVTTAQPASVLAAALVGPGVTILTPTLTCPGVANGTFTSTGTILSMSSGVLLTNGHASACAGPEGALVSYNNGTAGDAAMSPFLPAGVNTYDACILEFDMIAAGDSIGFNYQFGSEEYRTGVCTQYTDVFAFFISGPGIVGAPNIALVPGTTIPVEVNSVNDGIPGSSGGAIGNCTSLGAGSPFTSYYIDNTGGTDLSYRGYTTKFRAVHAVTPCDTYHLKLSIVDAGNAIYDSGVFLEGSSLTTNTYAFNHADSMGATIDGISHTIVKGCSPATIDIVAAHPNPVATTIALSFGGTAVNGIDVTAIPSTVVMPAGATSVSVNVQGIPTPAAGTKTLVVYIGGSCGILDSVSINIMDTPSAIILTPDTTVCAGQSFQIMVAGDADLTYSWAPPAGLSITTVMEPICTPLANTTYTMTATLPGSGCAAIIRTITVSVASGTLTALSNDTTICYGSSAQLFAVGSASSVYSWFPATGLSSTSIPNPVATPFVTTTYTVSNSVPGVGCPVLGMVTVTVANPNITLLTPDTAVCAGVSFNIRVNGDPTLSYSWTPATGLSNPAVMQPIASPSVNTTYIVTTTTPGVACSATAQFTVSMITFPVSALSQVVGCGTGINFSAAPAGPDYTYQWTGPAGFSSATQDPAVDNVTTVNQGVYTVTVTDNSDGCAEEATTSVVILPPSALQLTDVTPSQTITYGSSVHLEALNATFFMWTPNDGSLSNCNINDPVATPMHNTTYTVYGMTADGCVDSASVTIDVVYDSITIPTAFSPNNDGLNDLFRPIGMKYQKLLEFSVYNRWGQQVYTSANKELGWDGTFNGVPQDMGVYNYVLIVSLDDGNNRTYKGTVTLIR